MFKSKKTYKKANSGFTLIELLVVMALMALILTTIFAGYNQFGVRLTLQNTAFQLASTIREAQVFGSFGKYQDFDEFSALAVGVRIDRATRHDGGSFALFIDKDKNNTLRVYTAQASTGNNELIQHNRLTGGYSITDIIVSKAGVKRSVGTVYVFFTRPFVDAKILADNNTYDSVTFTLKSPFDDEIKVSVSASGQIRVHK